MVLPVVITFQILSLFAVTVAEVSVENIDCGEGCLTDGDDADALMQTRAHVNSLTEKMLTELRIAMPCKGNPETWDAGFGGCATYAKTKDNHEYCGADRQDEFLASDVCKECGVCQSSAAEDSKPEETDKRKGGRAGKGNQDPAPAPSTGTSNPGPPQDDPAPSTGISNPGPPQDVASAQHWLAKRAHKANGAMKQAHGFAAEAEKIFKELEDFRKKNGVSLEQGKGWWTRTVYGSVVDPNDPSKPGKAPEDCWQSSMFGKCRTADWTFLEGCCWRKDLPQGRPDAMDSTLKNPLGLNVQKGDPFTIEQDCDKTPGCNFYTCWTEGSELVCRVYSEGLLVLGGGKAESQGTADQLNQVSSCKGCAPESKEDREKRCAANGGGTCMSLAGLQDMCANVDMLVHVDLEEVPQYKNDHGGDHEQFHYAVYLSPQQLQCHGLDGWPQPKGIALVDIPSTSIQLTVVPPGTTKTYDAALAQSSAFSQAFENKVAHLQEAVYKSVNTADDVMRKVLVEAAKAEMAYRELAKLMASGGNSGQEKSLEEGQGWWTRTLLGSVVDPDDSSKPGKAPEDCWKSVHIGKCQTPDKQFREGCCYQADLACDDNGVCAPRAMHQAISNADLLMTVEKACDETPGCAFYTCWQVETQIQCRMYSHGRLVLGEDGRETSGKVKQGKQVSACKGCRGETEEERAARCGSKSDGICVAAAEMGKKCSEVDIRIHMDIEDVPEYSQQHGADFQQVLYNIYYTPEQLQCLGVNGYPELLGNGQLDFPISTAKISITCPSGAHFCTSSSSG
jgi:hypothetical protein